MAAGFRGSSSRRLCILLRGSVRNGLVLALASALALISLVAAGCTAPPAPTATEAATFTDVSTPAPGLTSTPTSSATPATSTAPTPTPVPPLPPTSVSSVPTPTLVPEWKLHHVAVDGSTVIVDLQWFAAVDVNVKLNERDPDVVKDSDGILRYVFKDVEPGKHSLHVNDVMGFSESRKIEVGAPTPTPLPKATPVPAPTATPTPTREELMERALSEYIPWYSDPPHPLALVPIREIWQRDSDLGRELAQAPWITDGLEQLEDDAVYGLGHLADYDPVLARRVLAYTMEEPVQDRSTLLLSTLGRMLSQHRDTFELLIAQTWFADGLNPEERAFITAVSHTTGIDRLYRGLLTERYSRSETILLPLAGEVTLWVFSNDAPPPNENILTVVERGARGAERIMAAPFPLTDLIVLSVDIDEFVASLDVDEYVTGYGGVNWGDSLVFLRGERLEPSDYGEILYHEIAHFWLSADIGPFWLYEGGANMVSEYVRAGAQALVGNEAVLSFCRDNGVPNIHAIGQPDHPNPAAQSTCGYGLGHHFLATLFNAIGEAAFSSAMGELYGLYLDYQPFATDEQVYRIFLKHTPPDREGALLDVFRRLHGGPFTDRH